MRELSTHPYLEPSIEYVTRPIIFYRCQQKSPELTLGAVGLLEQLLTQHLLTEESLDQVFGFLAAESFASKIFVNRPPVLGLEFGQYRLAERGIEDFCSFRRLETRV